MSATSKQMSLDPSDLNPTDVAILDVLHEGRASPAYIAEKRGYTSGNVRNRITHLASHDHVEGLGGGLYELVDDPREDVATETESDLRGRLQDAHERIDDLEASLADARETSQERNERLEDCRERLENAPDTAAIEGAVEDLETALERGDEAGIREAITRLKGAL